MQPLSADQVLALAPDASSAFAGRGLSSPGKWSGIGCSDRAIWGLCQGSGKDPYQTRVDLSGPAAKCSCPSRKFPCKHALGLMLLHAGSPAAFKTSDEPGWVSDWLATRAEKQEKKEERAKAAAENPPDLEAQAKRAAQRDARVKDGLANCRLWLDDLMRHGLAAARSDHKSQASFEQVAARMVDAQAPGLANHIRRIPDLLASGDNWDTRTLEHLARLHLLLTAAEKLDALPPDLATDVRTALGYNQSKDEVLAGPAVADRWCAVGQITEEEDRLKVRRTWLLGRTTARRALIVDFAAGLQPLDTSLIPGVEFDGELCFYPSRAPLRALVRSRAEATALNLNVAPAADATLESALVRYAHSLAQVPWLARWPIVLTAARIAQHNTTWSIIDTTSRALPIAPAFARSLNLWRLISATGGQPITITGEWDGEFFLPISALSSTAPAASAIHDLSPRWAA